MRLTRTLFLALLFVLLLLNTAFADGGDTVSPFQRVVGDLLDLALTAVGLIVSALAVVVGNKIRQKYNIEVPAAWHDRLQVVIDQAIAYADEQAHKRIGASTMASNEKLNAALDFVLFIIGDDKQLLALGKEKIKQMIEARVNMTRSYTMTAGTVLTGTLDSTETLKGS